MGCMPLNINIVNGVHDYFLFLPLNLLCHDLIHEKRMMFKGNCIIMSFVVGIKINKIMGTTTFF